MSNTIIPVTDLRNTNEISKLCHEETKPIFVTKNGYGDLVIMSTETFQTYETKIEELEEIASVLEAEIRRLKGEKTFELNDAFDEIRRKRFGKV